ncbi:acyl carrier protein [Actinoplanes regularis]|uniref:Acyl carrier protein n=1 Tax=Actinoplanes regularis TaxID=52697 RepID=A0A239I4B8_9ACTN|nr:acyl carrier protein [Actinoplanes regularis]GIE91361.1 hypothetical protein Are01nite_78410 [Actinoplanes regularis]GLW34607.1 hypothetical protein Areg01_75440 [Actinoplanes regularis]SNS88440.1 acyl carrier protein [Actinoplanes regularis]
MDSAYQIVLFHLKEHLDIDPSRVTPETTLEDLELDSLSVLELGLVLQDATGIRRLDEGVVTFRTTVGQIAAALHDHLTGEPAYAGTEVRMVSEAVSAGTR